MNEGSVGNGKAVKLKMHLLNKEFSWNQIIRGGGGYTFFAQNDPANVLCYKISSLYVYLMTKL